VLRGPENRGGLSSEFETPKALRGRGIGRGCPPPQTTRGSGDRRKLPQRSPRKRGLVHFELENKKLSYCWDTVRRESMPRIAEMDVELTT